MQVDFIRRWWCKKYNLPPTDDRLLKYTPEELLLEFYEDAYERKPNIQLPGDEELDAIEEPEIAATGDPLVDEIEKRLARGEDVEDLLDLMDPDGAPKAGENSLQRAETLLNTDDSFFSKESEQE